ncbi:MAG: hypothetical protein R2788_14710 [Saprospiraceae bacterium]
MDVGAFAFDLLGPSGFQRGGVGLKTDASPLKPLEEHVEKLQKANFTLFRNLIIFK